MKYIAGGIVLAACLVGIVMWLRGVPKSAPLDPGVIPPAISVPEEDPSSISASKPTQTPERSTTISNNTSVKNNMTIKTTKQGEGVEIKNGQTAVMEYTGKLTDGSVFDATSKHGGQPFEFVLGAGMVIKGWDQGVLGMKVGEERTLTIPSELGYGADGYPPVIPQNATLIFDIKLVAIK